MNKITEYQRQQIANLEYNKEAYKMGAKIRIYRTPADGQAGKPMTNKNSIVAGYVADNGHRWSGMNYSVIVDNPRNPHVVRVLFRCTTPVDIRDVVTDISQAVPEVRRQMRDAAAKLHEIMANPAYKGCKIEVYGHSLGSMQAQTALADLDDREASRISGAWMYEGPNMYSKLNARQQKRAQSYGSRVHNYIDARDPIIQAGRAGGMAYDDDGKVVGRVQRIQSKNIGNPVKQHVWGGYEWTKDGGLALDSKTISRIRDLRLRKLSRYAKSLQGGNPLSSSQRLFLDTEQALVLVGAADASADSFQAGVETDFSSGLRRKLVAELDAVFAVRPPEIVQQAQMAG